MAKAINTSDIWGRRALGTPWQHPLSPHPLTERKLGGIVEMGSLQSSPLEWLRVPLSVCRLCIPEEQVWSRRPALQPHCIWPLCTSCLQRSPAQRLTLTLQRYLNSAPKLAFLNITCILQRAFCMELLGIHSKIAEAPVCRIKKKKKFLSFQTQLQSSTSY